jgi:hypothetical protein
MSAQESVDVLLRQHAKRPEVPDELEDKESLFNSPPMLEAPPKDSDEIIEEMTRKMMMRLPKHPDMLSPEEQEKLDADEKERLAELEINRIIDQEMKASFDRMGLEYQGNDDTPLSIKMAFSKTACEYYSSKHRALSEQASAEQDSADQVGTAITDELSPIAEEIDHSDATLDKTELTEENKQTPYEVENEQSPFAHLSRAELLKRIGITN